MDQLAVFRRIGLVRNKIGLEGKMRAFSLPFFLMWISFREFRKLKKILSISFFFSLFFVENVGQLECSGL